MVSLYLNVSCMQLIMNEAGRVSLAKWPHWKGKFLIKLICCQNKPPAFSPKAVDCPGYFRSHRPESRRSTNSPQSTHHGFACLLSPATTAICIHECAERFIDPLPLLTINAFIVLAWGWWMIGNRSACFEAFLEHQPTECQVCYRRLYSRYFLSSLNIAKATPVLRDLGRGAKRSWCLPLCAFHRNLILSPQGDSLWPFLYPISHWILDSHCAF